VSGFLAKIRIQFWGTHEELVAKGVIDMKRILCKTLAAFGLLLLAAGGQSLYAQSKPPWTGGHGHIPHLGPPVPSGIAGGAAIPVSGQPGTGGSNATDAKSGSQVQPGHAKKHGPHHSHKKKPHHNPKPIHRDMQPSGGNQTGK
jgi:hypothetical protein